MHGKIRLILVLLLLVILSILFLLIKGFQSERGRTSSSSYLNENKINSLSQKNAEELLKSSIDVNYPDGMDFVPAYLTNDCKVIGEAVFDSDGERYLLSLDVKSGEKRILKKIEKSSEIVSFIVHTVFDNRVIFEEFDQINRTANYYDLNMDSLEYRLFHSIKNVTPVHDTQLSLQEHTLAINLYAPEIEGYKLYLYDTENFQIRTFENQNSGYPVFFKGNLYYIQIDNENHITQLLKDNLKGNREIISSTDSQSTFLFGIYSDNDNAVKLLYNEGVIELFDIAGSDILYQTEWMESVHYKHGYLSYLGDGREEGSRLAYYLLDLKNKIAYDYKDGKILLSDKGILWIQYKKDEREIEKGSIFTNRNSIMKYHSFE